LADHWKFCYCKFKAHRVEFYRFSTSIYRHPRHSAINCREQTMALHRSVTVQVKSGILQGRGKRYHYIPRHLDRGPPCLMFNGYWGSFPEVQRPGREVEHSPTSCAEVKNGWSYTSAPLYILMARTRKTELSHRQQ